jgi:hypothetical protein
VDLPVVVRHVPDQHPLPASLADQAARVDPIEVAEPDAVRADSAGIAGRQQMPQPFLRDVDERRGVVRPGLLVAAFTEAAANSRPWSRRSNWGTPCAGSVANRSTGKGAVSLCWKHLHDGLRPRLLGGAPPLQSESFEPVQEKIERELELELIVAAWTDDGLFVVGSP